jgi:hypothetical protein
MDSKEWSLPFARILNQRLPPIMYAGHIRGPVTRATNQLRPPLAVEGVERTRSHFRHILTRVRDGHRRCNQMYIVQCRIPCPTFDRDEAEDYGKICNSMNLSGAVCSDRECPRALQHVPERLQPASSNNYAVNACSLARDGYEF